MFIPDPDLNLEFLPIPDSGSRGQEGTGSRILDPDPQHRTLYELLVPVYNLKDTVIFIQRCVSHLGMAEVLLYKTISRSSSWSGSRECPFNSASNDPTRFSVVCDSPQDPLFEVTLYSLTSSFLV